MKILDHVYCRIGRSLFGAIPELGSCRYSKRAFSVFQLMITPMTATTTASIPTLRPISSPVPSFSPLPALLGSDVAGGFAVIGVDDDRVGVAVIKVDRNEVIGEEGELGVPLGSGTDGLSARAHIRQLRPNIRGQSSRNAGSRNIGDGAGVVATPD